MSRSRSIRIVLTRGERVEQSRRSQSCGSICVVYGLNSRPRPSTHARASASQSTSGIGDKVRVVVADRAVDLALERHARDRRDRASSRATTLAISLPSVVGVAGWPCVRASIGSVRVRVRERAQRIDDAGQRRQQHRSRAPPQHQPVREVVDVLGRAREVDELRDARDFGVAGEALLQPVLDRLDVVIGRALDRLDARGVGRRERCRRPRDASARRRCENGGDFGDAGFVGERYRATRSRRARGARISAYSLKCAASAATLAA